MSAWTATTLVVAITAVTAAATASAGPCPRESSRNCLNFPEVINFNSVPAISQQIVAEEHTDQKPQKLTIDPLTPAPYTGPTFGTSLGKRAPTIGYQWSLEPKP
jgi:hypothetical protein